MIITIALRELRSMFLSPLAWTVLAVVQIVLAWTFLTQLDYFFALQKELATMQNAPGVTDLVAAPLLEVASIVLLMVTPLLSMRLISEERRNGTLSLLLSAPLSMTEIVLGKYLGIVLFLLIFVLMITLMPLSLLMGTQLDLGKLAAAGLLLSSLTTNPVIAAISSFGLLLLLWIVGRNSGDTGDAFTYISMLNHYVPMLRGIVDTADVAYFVLFIVTFLLLTIRQMDAQRLQN
jgi:ABC-2 type transport system permease protein